MDIEQTDQERQQQDDPPELPVDAPDQHGVGVVTVYILVYLDFEARRNFSRVCPSYRRIVEVVAYLATKKGTRMTMLAAFFLLGCLGRGFYVP